MVALLLQEGASLSPARPPAPPQDSCLLAACRSGNWGLCELLLRETHRAASTKKGANGGGGGDVGPSMSALLQSEISVDKGQSCLHVAAYHGHTQVVEGLLNTLVRLAEAESSPVDAVLNLQCSSGATPLFLACQKGHLPIAATLLRHGASHHILTTKGASCVLVAAEHGHQAVCELLVDEYGADPCHCLPTGENAVYMAAQNGHSQVLSLLVDKYHVSVQQCRDNGASPLFTAAEHGHARCVQVPSPTVVFLWRSGRLECLCLCVSVR